MNEVVVNESGVLFNILDFVSPEGRTGKPKTSTFWVFNIVGGGI